MDNFFPKKELLFTIYQSIVRYQLAFSPEHIESNYLSFNYQLLIINC